MSADFRTAGPHLLVIIGASGDLAQRKLFPALYDLLTGEEELSRSRILGVGTRDIGDGGLRRMTVDALTEAGKVRQKAARWCEDRLHYLALGPPPGDYAALAARASEIERDAGLDGNRVFYLATPPSFFPDAIRGIGETGLKSAPGWVRLVVEKPFGRDLESARTLNELVHRYFDEPQIFRIDHYLGKETVQNLLVFRFANMAFESLWNRDKIAAVEITMAENLGVEGRARYYERAGALRDIVQNHLAQVLALTAMEAPPVFSGNFIRDEKVKVLRSILPIEPGAVVFGQYGRGTIGGAPAPAYREEPGVSPDSAAETYAALRLRIDNWRWHGVPFFLRTGKRLARRLTRIVITFHRPPGCMFVPFSSWTIHSNRLVVTLQPNEGFHIMFEIKEPGDEMHLRTESLRFRYADVFGRLPEAYETLVRDILAGDQTLFVRADEVETAWQLLAPILAAPPEVHTYQAGTWGPSEADALPAGEGYSWSNPPEI